jgi:S-adenosylmethionine synthetase
VDTGGAGDQGMMIGYACDETAELMPLAIHLAHRMAERLTEVRKKGILDYLGPDGKTQVTVIYENGMPKRVDNLVIAAQHTEEILDKTGKFITEKARKEIIDNVAKPILKKWIDKDTKYYVNQTGKFVIGGPQSDTGMTGRKIIVDTYGGAVSHGGGAFSGKDPTKVDRSAAYMARYVAKNIVAAKLAKKCLIQLAYVIGKAEPVSIMIDTFDTSDVPEEKLIEIVRRNFDLTPKGIINTLDLLRPIYRKTAAYGHFGRENQGFIWEMTDKAKILAKEA